MRRETGSFGKMLFQLLLMLFSNQLYASGLGMSSSPVTKVFYQSESPQQCFGMEKLKLQLKISREISPEAADILILTSREQFEKLKLATEFSQLRPEGFVLKKLPGNKLAILSTDQTGAMYGIMDVAEQLQMGQNIATISEKTIQPKLTFRGIKFNLPWNSYRTDESLQLHEATIKDLKYWEQVVKITGKYIEDVSLVHLNKRYVNSGNARPLARFSWANLLSEVKNDVQIAKTAEPFEVHIK
jgi:hypothetical protein